MKIYFIGIGGIGISGIANVYKERGNVVLGSDREKSEITDELILNGTKVFIGHNENNLESDVDLVIYSEAVPEDNPEMKRAKSLGIKVLSGAQAIAQLSKDYFLIAVSGMHGKSTTASMIANILVDAELDPSFIIGAKPGYRVGKGKYLVIEADDYKAKFLNYFPDILVLTNIEEEHMDYYENFSHIKKVFEQYLNQVKNFIIANRDDEGVRKILIPNLPRTARFARCNSSGIKQFSIFKPYDVIYYSIDDKEAEGLKNVLKVPGVHNIYNALAALKTARALGINDEISFKSLSEFKGIWRRFEIKELEIGNWKLEIVNDYAHHPTEIRATFQALAERFPDKKIWVVFQPHQYQRTFYLFDDFIKVFKEAKEKFSVYKLILTDIYDVAGREDKTIREKVNSKKFVDEINRKEIIYIPQNELPEFLKENLTEDSVLVIMGAGDIYKLSEKLNL